MLPEKIEKAFNEQIKHELESAYIYLSMAAWLHKKGYDGIAQWYRVQTQEEMVHAMKFFDHINNRGGKVVLQNIAQLKTEWKSLKEVVADGLAHEEFITSKINDLVKLSKELDDFASMPMLNWLVEEQVEEEVNANKNVDNVNMVGENGQGILMLDREMGARVFVMPPAKEV